MVDANKSKTKKERKKKIMHAIVHLSTKRSPVTKLSGCLRKYQKLHKIIGLSFRPTGSKRSCAPKNRRYKCGNTVTFIFSQNVINAMKCVSFIRDI